MGTPLSIKFWGTRGLISSPRNNTAIFGGNTTSIQVLYKNMNIIVDTGFGVTNLGEKILEANPGAKDPTEVHIFYTHFHWDHIQGLPFFAPIYFKTTTMNLYSPVSPDEIFENLDLLFDGSYSPFSGLRSMPSNIQLKQLTQSLELNGLTIDFQKIDHQQTNTYAFRFHTKEDDRKICIVTDHEARPSALNDELIAFCHGCDLLIHDGQYTKEEYQTKVGWGHSTVEQALTNAAAIGSRTCLLTHHDPARTDANLQMLQKDLRKDPRFRNVSFEFAREDVVYPVAVQVPATKKVAG